MRSGLCPFEVWAAKCSIREGLMFNFRAVLAAITFQNETKWQSCLVFALINARTVPIETRDWRRKTREWVCNHVILERSDGSHKAVNVIIILKMIIINRIRQWTVVFPLYDEHSLVRPSEFFK